MTISHTKSSPDFRGPVPFQRERQRQRDTWDLWWRSKEVWALSLLRTTLHPGFLRLPALCPPELAVLLALRRDFATLASGFQYSGETAKRPVRREPTRTPKISEKKAFKTLFPSVLLFGGFTNQSMNSNQIKNPQPFEPMSSLKVVLCLYIFF